MRLAVFGNTGAVQFGQDPAVANGPLLTTITDMAGIFFVLSLATLMMPWRV